MKVLDAVNRILPFLEESPTTTVYDNRPVTAAVVAALDAERGLLLQAGWWFNQRTCTLQLSAEKTVAVPSNCIAGYCPDLPDVIEVRDGFLLNLTTGTTEFSSPVLYQYLEDVSFPNLPAAAAEVVLWSAAFTAYIPDFEFDRTAQVLQTRRDQAAELLMREHLRHRKLNIKQYKVANSILSALRG